MSNQSSCRVLRTLGMDGFLGFKCGPSCSEKQHNKDIKALIDAIDDLLAYDSKTKKELGATDPGIDVSLMARGLTGKLDDINNKAYVLLGKHIPDPFESSDQPRMVTCDKNLRGLVVTVDSIRGRVLQADDPTRRVALSEQDRSDFEFYRGSLRSSHHGMFGFQ